MRKPVTIVSSFITASLFATSAAIADPFKLADPDAGKVLFGTDHVLGKAMYSAEWVVKGGACLFAITCFISAGNLARQGQYGRAGGAMVGGIIAAIGAYLVTKVQV